MALMICTCGHEWWHDVEDGDFGVFCPVCGKLNDTDAIYWDDWDELMDVSEDIDH